MSEIRKEGEFLSEPELRGVAASPTAYPRPAAEPPEPSGATKALLWVLMLPAALFAMGL